VAEAPLEREGGDPLNLGPGQDSMDPFSATDGQVPHFSEGRVSAQEGTEAVWRRRQCERSGAEREQGQVG
jgi:hypothetical protein